MRSAVSVAAASRAPAVLTSATAPLVSSLAGQAARRSANVNLAALAAARVARYFSQTTRVANEETDANTTEKAPATESNEITDAAAAEAARHEGETDFGIYIRNVVFDATEQHLKEAFEHYGTVTKVAIARDARGLSRGYAFIWFEKPEAQTKAIAEAHGSFWHGRRIIVQQRTAPRTNESGERSVRSPTDSLYIGNLPYETTDADLNEMFREMEGLKAVRVAVDRSTGWPRGFAHADFETVEQAKAAFEALIDRQIGDRTLRIDYAMGYRPRNNQNQNQNQNRYRTPSQSQLRY